MTNDTTTAAAIDVLAQIDDERTEVEVAINNIIDTFLGRWGMGAENINVTKANILDDKLKSCERFVVNITL